MKRFLQSGLVIAAGVLGIAAAQASADQDVTANRKKFDLREAVLRRFFKDNKCPAENFAGVFVAEADAHHLDWRLLPSLAFVETGAGKQARGNNLFGWANGKTRFGSISEAIHEVATGLAEHRPYKNKDVMGKLRAYNRNLGYQALVSGVMERIAPIVPVMSATE
jgi:hypothetical protein